MVALPPPAIVRRLVFNPELWRRIWPVEPTDPDDWFETTIGATSDRFEEFEEVWSKHGREQQEGDDELVTRYLSIPIYLPDGFTWEIELYDNGEDAGQTFYLHGPNIRRTQLGVADPQPRLPVLRWPELERLCAVLDRDERNREAGIPSLGPLLFWTPVGLNADDRLESIRARLEDAWRESGLVKPTDAPDVAALSIAGIDEDGARQDSWQLDPEIGWCATSHHSLRRHRGKVTTALAKLLDAIEREP